MSPSDYPDTTLCMIEGGGVWTLGEIRGSEADRVLTTGEAADRFGYSPDTWRRWAPEIHGAYQDSGGRPCWRLPYPACVEHLRQVRAERSKRRRARGPWGKGATAQAGTTGPPGHQERSMVGRRPAPVERRAANDARPATLRLA